MAAARAAPGAAPGAGGQGDTAQVLRFPEDPYTIELLDAVPQPARAGPAEEIA